MKDFEFIEEQFVKCDRDANSVLVWLTDRKDIPRQIALETMHSFAKLIASGHTFGFNNEGLSVLSLSVLEACLVKKRSLEIQAGQIGAHLLQAVAQGMPNRGDLESAANDVVEILAMIWEKLDEPKQKARERKATSFWRRLFR